MARTTTIRFVLDGEVIELDNPRPTRTLLEYLREDRRRTGTKEGCAEGDCGACTVVLAEPGPDGRLRAQAINACIRFLPTLDGKELLTVESLRTADGLHPVQQAMLDCHGSQCGFCTPGFVMSLFALYKAEADPDRVTIDDALAGNLCRCTGYRPIIDAARNMYERTPQGSDDWRLAPANAAPTADEKRRLEKLAGISHDDTIALEHGGQHYFAPRTADELSELLGDYPDATLLAGGTDVGLWVTKQLRELDTVIYTGRVRELHALESGDDELRIGAAVSLSDAMPELIGAFPTLEELLLRFASPPIRNAGTLGGNVANGSPIGDSMPALLALDSRIVLQSAAGMREVPLSAFYLDYQVKDLRPGEFLREIRIPKLGENESLHSWKISKRFDQDISAVCGAFFLRRDGESLTEARIAYGGMAAIPARASAAEAVLRGAEFSETVFEAAARALDTDFAPITDMRASDEYRQRVAKNLLTRWHAALAAADAPGVYEYGRRRRA